MADNIINVDGEPGNIETADNQHFINQLKQTIDEYGEVTYLMESEEVREAFILKVEEGGIALAFVNSTSGYYVVPN